MMSKQNVPELRFPEFSGAFKEYSLDDLVKVIDCLHSTAPISSENTNYKMIRTGNVRNGNLIVSTMDSVKKKVYEKWSSKGYLEPKDIILTREAPMGEVAIIPQNSNYKFFLGQRCLQLKVRDNFIDSEYMYLLLQGKKFEKYIRPLKFSGSTVSNIRIPELKSFKFLIPELNEQVKVKEILLKLNRLIELEEKKLELLEEQKKGYMQKIFSQELRFKDENGNDYPEWEEKNLEDMGVTYTGLSGKTKENFGVGDAQFITYKNVFDYLFADVRGIQQVEIKEDEKQSSVRKNDILFTTSSETPEEVGMASIWSYETSNTYLNSFCFGYRLEDYEVSAEFLAISLRQEYMRRKITLLGQGSTRFNLSKREVMKLSVFIPCLQEQFKITDLYKKMMYRIDMKKEKINSLKRRKEGLLQNLFI